MTIYFYKVNDPYGCFSNFSPHPIHLEGLDWKTVEHYYQSHKYAGTAYEDLMEKIRQAETPEDAAAMGRSPSLTLRSDWEEAKQAVMWKGVLTKFLTHRDIQEVLLATGDERIVEDSARDYYWGRGKDGTGRNELGKMLMAVREEIRQRLLQE